MKRLVILLIFLALAACLPSPQITLVPPETLAAQTLAARPKTDTPVPSATATLTATPTEPVGNPTPELDLTIPGAYCLPTNTPRQKGLVSKVVDPQTIEVVVGYDTLRVRYIGVDAPLISPPPPQWQAPQAYAFNESLVNGQVVTLVQDITDLDAEGNSLRYVLAGKSFINYEIIRQGLARHQSMPPDVACDNSLIAAQVEAQGGTRGVWMPTPAPTFTITPTPTNTVPPTATRLAPCDCTGPRLTCNFFPNQNRAQACYEYCRSQGFGDIFGLDKNNNGLACEGMP